MYSRVQLAVGLGFYHNTCTSDIFLSYSTQQHYGVPVCKVLLDLVSITSHKNHLPAMEGKAEDSILKESWQRIEKVRKEVVSLCSCRQSFGAISHVPLLGYTLKSPCFRIVERSPRQRTASDKKRTQSGTNM